MNDFWTGKKVLVTGAMGFVGSHITRKLVDQGAEVIAVDRVTAFTPAWMALGLEKVHVHVRDLEDGPGQYIYDADVVFHLAGMVSVQKCEDAPLSAVRDNIMATARVLGAIRQHPKCGAAVFASSDRVYGSRRQPNNEIHALEPTDVYGATKAAADILCAQAARSGRPVAMLRHVNAYGELDPHTDHLIPGTILSILRGEEPVIRSDGSPRKSYLHIDDVVSAYLFLAARVHAGHARGAYNCAMRFQYTVREVVDWIADEMDYTGPVKMLSTDLTQQDYQEILSTSKLGILGWSSQVPLGVGLKRVIQHHRSRVKV